MQAALRPYVTAGVALVGASAIAVSPVTATPAAVEEVHDAALELTALVNPIDAFRPVLEAAAANLQTLSEAIAANPAPILKQILTNQLNGVANIGSALEAQAGVLPQLPELLGQIVAGQLGSVSDLAGIGATFVDNLTDVLTGSEPGTVRGQLQDAIDQLEQGQFGQAFQLLAVLPLLPVLGNGLSNINLIPPLIAALQQPLADAADLFPVAAGPLTNAQAALGVLGDPLNALIIGVGALTAIAGVADAAGNTVGGLIGAVRNGDPEAGFNTIVTEAANGTTAVLNGAFAPDFSVVAGLQGLREAIAAAITTPSFPAAPNVASANAIPSEKAQSFTLTAPIEKVLPAPKATTPSDDQTPAAGGTGTDAKDTSGTAPTETKDGVKGGNVFTPGSSSTKGGRHRADNGPSFGKELRDAVKGLTGLGRSSKPDKQTVGVPASGGESGSGSSDSGNAGSGSIGNK
jgi:hypothetical protein